MLRVRTLSKVSAIGNTNGPSPDNVTHSHGAAIGAVARPMLPTMKITHEAAAIG